MITGNVRIEGDELIFEDPDVVPQQRVAIKLPEEVLAVIERICLDHRREFDAWVKLVLPPVARLIAGMAEHPQLARVTINSIAATFLSVADQFDAERTPIFVADSRAVADLEKLVAAALSEHDDGGPVLN